MASDRTPSNLSSDELVELLDNDPALWMLDVRDPDEFLDWQIPGAINIPLDRLADRVDEVPRNQDVVVICAAGPRADRGARILFEHDVASRVLDGGMSAWASTYDTVQGRFGAATVVQLRRRGKGCLSYVIGAVDRAVVIDPSLHVDHYLKVAASNAWRITDVLDTHLHADHLSGARALVEETGATLRLSPFDPFTYDFEPLVDGLTVQLAPGVGLSVAAVAVPGHTEGSTLYQLSDQAIFTGDTLFLESVGRPDLADQAVPFAHNLYRSLHERVLPLGDDVMVFPAHYGPGVAVHVGQFVAKPLGELRQTLPVLALGESEFVAWAVANVKDRPPNYKKIVLINAGFEPVTKDATEIELGPNRCAIA
jgi:glyoxylase-like metal-dependent hydrolase (beta-lactamase superfamily II)/rhodanese-related sulfurtransferase